MVVREVNYAICHLEHVEKQRFKEMVEERNRCGFNGVAKLVLAGDYYNTNLYKY